MRKQLIVQGESAFDIFSVLITMLKTEVIRQFGNHITLRDGIESELDELAKPFQEYGIVLQHQVLDQSRRHKDDSSGGRILPDYKVWIPLSKEKILCLNFDYLPSLSRPCHLE